MDKPYYKIVVEGRPIPKSNTYGVRVIGKRGIIYTTRELEDYELMIGKLISEEIPQVLERGFYSLYLRVYQHGKKWIDIDNCFKGILDASDHGKEIKRGKQVIAMTNSGIEDDRYYQLLIGERIIVDSADEQRVEIIITPYRGLLNFAQLIMEIYGLSEEYYKELNLPLD